MTGATDSGGHSFEGRTLSGSDFAGDDGSIDPALAAALEQPGDDRALMAALATARLLVPIVAAPAEGSPPGSDANADMAVITLTAPDGARALPVFSGTGALAQWDPAARPSPVVAAMAARAAIAERCDSMVLDLGSAHEVTVRPSMVWALAQQQPWLPADQDPHVARALKAAIADEPDVTAISGEPGSTPGELRVVLAVLPGLTQPELAALARRVGETIATDGETRARIDGLAFAVVAAQD